MFLIRLSNFTHLLWAGVLKCGIVLPFAVCHPVKGTARLDLWHFFIKGHKREIVLFIRKLSITSLSCISESTSASLDNFFMEMNRFVTFVIGNIEVVK